MKYEINPFFVSCSHTDSTGSVDPSCCKIALSQQLMSLNLWFAMLLSVLFPFCLVCASQGHEKCAVCIPGMIVVMITRINYFCTV